MALNPLVEQTLDRLASLDPGPYLVVSLYLNTAPDQHGRANFGSFVRKEFKAVARTLPRRSPELAGFERDRGRIQAFLRDELRPSANGVAIFSCAGDFFEALQLDVPVPFNRLYVTLRPHLYTLALLGDQYPRHAVLVADTNRARLFVIGLRRRPEREEVRSPKTSRTSAGGWSQARYQRHIEAGRLQHVKEVIEVLDRVVWEENISRIILAGDEVIRPVLQSQMPPHLAAKVADFRSFDIRVPEHQLYSEAIEAVRLQDTQEDARKVRQMLEEYRSGGLAVVGRAETLEELSNGRVEELLITASLKKNHARQAEAMVRAAVKTGAAVTFIEDEALLEAVGGAGGLLRYRSWSEGLKSDERQESRQS